MALDSTRASTLSKSMSLSSSRPPPNPIPGSSICTHPYSRTEASCNWQKVKVGKGGRQTDGGDDTASAPCPAPGPGFEPTSWEGWELESDGTEAGATCSYRCFPHKAFLGHSSSGKPLTGLPVSIVRWPNAFIHFFASCVFCSSLYLYNLAWSLPYSRCSKSLGAMKEWRIGELWLQQHQGTLTFREPARAD